MRKLTIEVDMDEPFSTRLLWNDETFGLVLWNDEAFGLVQSVKFEASIKHFRPAVTLEMVNKVGEPIDVLGS